MPAFIQALIQKKSQSPQTAASSVFSSPYALVNSSTNPNPADAAYLLRVMSGPQAGAEIPLADGEYVIGSDDDCDLVLLDETVAARHLRVTIAASGAEVAACDAPVALGERTLAPGEPADIGAGAVFGLASTCVAIGPVGVVWTALPMPDRRRRKRTPEPAPTANAVTDDGEASVADSDAPDSNAVSLALGDQLINAERDRRGNGKGSGPGRRTAALWAVGGFLLALALFELPDMLSAWTAAPAPQTPPDNADQQRSQVAALLKKLNLKGLQLGSLPGGGLALSGYVQTVADKDRLNAALRQSGIAVRNDVWADEWIKSSVQETVQRFGGEALSVDYLGKGALRIAGFLRSGVSQQQLEAVVRNDIPGISSIEVKLHTMDQALQDLRKGLQEAGLEGMVKLTASDTTINATGTLDQPLLQAWWQVAHAFAKDYGTVPRLQSEVKGATQRAEPFTLGNVRVIGIVMGPEHQPMAMLDNGNLVGVGDQVGANAVVKEIDFDKVLITEGTRTYTFNVEGG